ncbi:MAG: response regulator [Balneolaceae bacterium]
MNVVIIEDDLILALSLEMMIRKSGYTITGKFTTGEEAVSAMPDLEVDIMLVDIQLGKGITGIEAVKRIQEQAPIPAIYITGNSDDLNRKLASDTNFVEYLIKPITFNELKSTLEQLGSEQI